MKQLKIRKYIILSAFILFAFGFVQIALASKLYLEPKEGEYRQGDIFITEIRLNTEGKQINTIEATIIFPTDILEVKDFSQGSSILSLWIKKPVFSNKSGAISFSGGIPHGYQGDGLLGKIVFEVKGKIVKNEAEILFVSKPRILLNDGFGTEDDVTAKGSTISISTEIAGTQKNEWLQRVSDDKAPPEPFEIKIGKNQSIFDGKYFIVFNAVDNQTGVDFYEVKEGEKGWEKTNSPHVLENQTLGREIQVRAIDKSGNVRTMIISPDEISGVNGNTFWKKVLIWIILILIAGWLVRLAFIKVKQKRRSKTKKRGD